MRKVTSTIACIFVVLLLFSRSDGEKSPINTTVNLQVIDKSYSEFKKEGLRHQPFKNKVQKQDVTLHTVQKGASIVDTLEWWSGSIYSCYNGWLHPNDTLIILYQALGPCSLISVEARWGPGGTAEFHIWERDTLTGSPGADLLPCGSYRWEVDSWKWEQVNLSADSLSVNLDYTYLVTHYGWFIVGYIVGGTGDTAEPQICYDYPQHEYPPHSLWSCHDEECAPGWNGLHAGNLWVEWLNRVIVKYYAGGTPPAISSVSQLSDTYLNSGPFKVTAEAYDLDGTIVDAWLFYTVKGAGIIDSIEMAITPAKGKVSLYGEILGSYSVWDTVGYQVKAIDNDGREGMSDIRSFIICEPQNPAAEILIVNDNGGNRDWFYWTILSSTLGKECEVWEVEKHRGIDSSVTNYGWPTIIWFGYEVSHVPAKDYNNSAIASFLKNGNSLFLTSPDYFYHNDIPSDEWTNFVPGEFAYDYLGVASCKSDPGFTTGESEGDTAFMGVLDDPISNDWADTILVINNSNWPLPNWADYVQARSLAYSIFYGTPSGECRGVGYEGGDFKTVFIPWVYEAASYDDAVTLMRNILIWFGQIEGVEEAWTSNLMYRLYQNSPNPFSNITCICYEIPMKSTVLLKVFDITGRLLKVFNFVEQEPGKHAFSLNASELTTGVYFYSVEAGNFKAIQKMLIIK